MAREDGKHLGPATKGQGKGTGTGGMTDLQDELVGENTVLSNRDKAQHSRDRGQDTKWVQTEQLEDHDSNKGRGQRGCDRSQIRRGSTVLEQRGVPVPVS